MEEDKYVPSSTPAPSAAELEEAAKLKADAIAAAKAVS
jgi:hypothetical protein